MLGVGIADEELAVAEDIAGVLPACVLDVTDRASFRGQARRADHRQQRLQIRAEAAEGGQ